MLTLTLTTPMTDAEAGAAAAMLLTLNPDAVLAALEGLDAGQMRLPLEPTTGPHTQVVTLAAQPSPEQAFGTPDDVMPPEAGVPTAPPAPPAPDVMPPEAGVPYGVEVDAEGLPWDDRIHSSNRKKSANGVWMKRRGLNQLVDQRVRAELAAAMAAPIGQAAPPPPPVETPAARTLREAVEGGLVPGAPPVPPVAAAAPPPPAPPPPAVSATPAPAAPAAPPAAAPAPDAMAGFAAAMRKVTAAQTAGHITVEETNAVIAQLGLSAVRDLIARPDLVPTFEASVQLHVDRYAPAAG